MSALMLKRSNFYLLSHIFTKLNAYIAVAALLLIFDLVLATRLIVAWHDSHSDQSAQYTTDLATYAQLKAQAGRLQGLPAQLSASRKEADGFVAARIPPSNSALVTELGTIMTRNHVRLSRATYPASAAIPGMVQMGVDANVTGEYTAIMHFINDLERDKNHAFFIIRSIELNGQQGGVVNLRIRLTSYMDSDAVNAAILQAGSRAAGSGTDSGEIQ